MRAPLRPSERFLSKSGGTGSSLAAPQGLQVHRILPEFMCQGGDITTNVMRLHSRDMTYQGVGPREIEGPELRRAPSRILKRRGVVVVVIVDITDGDAAKN